MNENIEEEVSIFGSKPILYFDNSNNQNAFVSFNFVEPEDKEKPVWHKVAVTLKVFVHKPDPNNQYKKDVYMIFFDLMTGKIK